jgi:hypothetical protein
MGFGGAQCKIPAQALELGIYLPQAMKLVLKFRIVLLISCAMNYAGKSSSRCYQCT